MKFYQIPTNLTQEIRHLERSIADFQKGVMHPTQFKGIRVPFGVYEQRKEETYMMRIRCTGGGLTPTQLIKAAELAGRYGSRHIHITSRQEMQLHDVSLEDVSAIMRELLKVNLSTRGGGGNTIRNIIASHDSGINPQEVFDVEPYAMALSSLLIAESDSWTLPRKLKISFSSLASDNANATVQDVGFIAAIRDGQQGFKVYVAGGMGAKPSSGHLLYEFVPAEQCAYIAKAVKSLFYKYGNRKNKHRNRLRFLWQDLGEKRFQKLFQQELQEWQKEPSLRLELPEMDNVSSTHIDVTPIQAEGSRYERWSQRNVSAQKQAGLYSIRVPLFLGDIRSEYAVELGKLLTLFGENVLRCSMNQNLYIRNIPEPYLGNIFQGLAELQSLADQPAMFGNIIACTGANTCKLGICLPRGLTPAIQNILRQADLDLERLKDFKMHISGCPNSCGQHWIGDLGFFGKVQRHAGRAFPAYELVAGTIAEPGDKRLGKPINWVPAYNVPEVTRDILEAFLAQDHATFTEYVNNGGQKVIEVLCEQYQNVPDFSDDKNYYFDWGTEELFSTTGIGRGECSAGLFDLIEVDQQAIRTNRVLLESADHNEQALYNIVFSACRMLLVTKGIETHSNDEVFEQFLSTFIRTGFIAKHFETVVRLAQAKHSAELLQRKTDCFALAEAVIKLYESMDDSLTFPAEKAQADSTPFGTRAARDEPAAIKPEHSQPEKFKDYRGVNCPMNFVKTKIDLASMQTGQTLEIYLDDGEPIENVPRSVEAEGHHILVTRQIENYWSVIIRKV